MFLKGVKHAHYQFIIRKSAPGINSDKPMPDNYGWKRDCDKYISVITTLPPDPEAHLQLIKCGYSKSLGVSAKLTIYIVLICVEDPCKILSVSNDF